MKTLVLFDFDGTITSRDTLFEISKSSTSSFKYLLKIIRLLPVFLLMKLSWISAQRGKEKFLDVFFGRWSHEDFDQHCLSFCTNELPLIIRPKALEAIEKWKEKSADIYIVSASPVNWIHPWAKQYDITVIGTRLKQNPNKFIPTIEGQNCNYEEKVNRIRSEIDLSKYVQITAYGDSKGDLPMLNLAHQKHYKPFT